MTVVLMMMAIDHETASVIFEAMLKRPDKRAYMNSKNEKKKLNCKQGVKKTQKSLYDFPK
jgi:hypothetical protein